MNSSYPRRRRAGKSGILSRSGVLLPVLLLFVLLPLAGCHSSDDPSYSANYREYAYVTNGGDNTVTVLDVMNLRQDRVIAVGADPTGVAANPRRNEVYVVNTGSNSVSVIDTEKKAVVATIPVGRKPYFIAVSPDGARGFVANSASNTVSVIDLERRRVVATVGVGEAPGLAAISPDGKTLVVSNRLGGSASIIDVTVEPRKMRVRSVFSGCPGATDIAILPHSRKAFVACSAGHQVMAIQLASPPPSPKSAKQRASEAPVRKDALLALLDVGKTPISLALKPDGGEIYAVNYDSGSVSEIDTSTNEVGGAYFVGTHPASGVIAQDDSTLYVSDFGADSLSVFSIDDGQLIASSRTGDGPDAMAFSKAGDLLFAVDAGSGDVAVIRTSSPSHSLLTMLPAGSHPNGIAVKSFLIKPRHSLPL
jgi:YVTN family beta-propeller protein